MHSRYLRQSAPRTERNPPKSGIVHVVSGIGNQVRGRANKKPLSASEWAEAGQVAARLKAELSALIETLPEHSRHASGLARELSVLRVTCHRVVAAVQDEASPMTLARLPGVEGLRQFIDGFRKTGVDAAERESALSAVEAFERLIAASGGSQTKLIERLQAGGGAGGEGDETELASKEDRAGLFEFASRVTGRSCEVALSIYAFRECADAPGMMDRALAKGIIGSLLTPGGLPMVLSSGDTVHGEEEARRITLLHGENAQGRTPEAMLKPFTTDPLPMVTSRGRGGVFHQVIDPMERYDGQPLDVVTALRARHPVMDPQTGKPTLDAVWSLVNCPSKRLILDVYLDLEMERKYRPSIESLMWSPGLEVPEDQKWFQRLPSQPKLILLGRGLDHAASPLWGRHAELTEYFFRHIGWDPEEFIGFRCEVEYPIWRAGYRMGFEYLRPRRGEKD